MANDEQFGDSVSKFYQDFFRKQLLDRIAVHEDLWTDAAAKTPKQRPLFDLILSHLNELRAQVPQIAIEASSFIQKIDKADSGEALDRLDLDLAHRELVFGKMLIVALIENWRITRLEPARGRVRDLEGAPCVREVAAYIGSGPWGRWTKVNGSIQSEVQRARSRAVVAAGEFTGRSGVTNGWDQRHDTGALAG